MLLIIIPPTDYLLMQGDVWESTLLYSQVDKDMKEGMEYMELVEYLRVAVANVFMGGYSSGSDTSPSPEPEQPIH